MLKKFSSLFFVLLVICLTNCVPTKSPISISSTPQKRKQSLSPTIEPTGTYETQNPPWVSNTLTTNPSDITSVINRFSNLIMFNSTSGWAIFSPPFRKPENSQVLRTTSGIVIWDVVTPPLNINSSVLRSAFFIDQNLAIAVATRTHLPKSQNTDVFTWHTVDGGMSWEPGEQFTTSIPEFIPNQLFFVDSLNGYMLGQGNLGMKNIGVYIFKTSDGGKHWNEVYDYAAHISDEYTLKIRRFYPYLGNIFFLSSNYGYFSNGQLFVTQDGGISWKGVNLIPPSDLSALQCSSGNCPYLDTVSSPSFTSSQNGTLMRRVYQNTETGLDVFVNYPNTTNRSPLPFAQYIYYTNDGGATWIPKPSPAKTGTVFFLDAKLGWMLGKSDPDPKKATILYQTVDGGNTWTQISSDCPLLLGSILQFIDNLTGFAYSSFITADFYVDFDDRINSKNNGSVIYMTIDGGQSWKMIQPKINP